MNEIYSLFLFFSFFFFIHLCFCLTSSFYIILFHTLFFTIFLHYICLISQGIILPQNSYLLLYFLHSVYMPSPLLLCSCFFFFLTFDIFGSIWYYRHLVWKFLARFSRKTVVIVSKHSFTKSALKVKAEIIVINLPDWTVYWSRQW